MKTDGKEEKVSFVSGKNYYPELELPICYTDKYSDINLIGTEDLLSVILVKDGTLAISVNQRIQVLSAPSIIYLESGITASLEKANSLKVEIIAFHPNVINSKFTIENIYEHDNPIFTTTDRRDLYLLGAFLNKQEEGGVYSLNDMEWMRAAQLFTGLSRELFEQRDWYWPCRSRSFLLEFLLFSTNISAEYRDSGESYNVNLNRDLLSMVVFIKNNLHLCLTIEDLAEKFYTNRTSLNHLFTTYLNKPVKSFIIAQKLELACSLLRDTLIPVREVADRIGYEDMTNFGRIFKKYIEETPSKYREKYNSFKYDQFRTTLL